MLCVCFFFDLLIHLLYCVCAFCGTDLIPGRCCLENAKNVVKYIKQKQLNDPRYGHVVWSRKKNVFLAFTTNDRSYISWGVIIGSHNGLSIIEALPFKLWKSVVNVSFFCICFCVKFSPCFCFNLSCCCCFFFFVINYDKSLRMLAFFKWFFPEVLLKFIVV